MADCSESENNASVSSCGGDFGQMDAADDATRYTLRNCFCVAYALLFVIGTVGNVTVIAMIVNVLTTTKRKRSHKVGSSATHHVFVYVLGLSIVDLAVMLHLPFLISDILVGEWMFGVFMCKLYWIGETVNKLLSTFIMTVLSWDRFLAVCAPVRSLKMRSNSVAMVVLFACVVAATILLSPVLIKSTVREVDKVGLVDADKQNMSNTLTKCTFDGDNDVFILYTFACGFALPAFLMIVFYTRVIVTLRHSAEAVRRYNVQLHHAHNPRLQQVTKRIAAVIVFYFLCWTPQWTLNLLHLFDLLRVTWSTLTLNAIFFGAHLLVCFNSAANPILYALINRELRQQHSIAMEKRRQSLSSATHAAMDFIGKHSHSPFRRKGTVPPAAHVRHYSTDRSLAGFNKAMSLTVTAYQSPNEDLSTSDVSPYRRNRFSSDIGRSSKVSSTPSSHDAVELEETVSLMRHESANNNNSNNGVVKTEILTVA